MNSFENIVALFLEEEGYWVRQSVKVHISKQEKKEIGTPTMPNPEIDLVALGVARNELLLFEVKSYLDSPGVRYSDISGKGEFSHVYKLFTRDKFRKIITAGLIRQFKEKGFIGEKLPNVVYALAAGKIKLRDKDKIENYFRQKKWRIYSPEIIKEKIQDLAEKGWENNIVTMTVKLLLRN